jgi:integrase/recombinase XerC
MNTGGEEYRGMDRIQMFLEYLVEDRSCQPGTIETYGTILRHMDRELEYGLAASNADEIRDWINAGGRADSTRATYRAAAASFFVFATDPAAPLLSFNPMPFVPKIHAPRGVPHPAGEDELADILARAGRPYRDWYVLASFGGLRCFEMANLDREHVTPMSMRLLGKGGKFRDVPVHPAVWAVVKDMPVGPVVRDCRGGRATRRGISRRGNRYLQRTLGYTGLHMHLFRHRFASQIYQSSGYDLRLTQELLGHANVTTTQGYVAVAAPARARAVLGLRAVA